MSLPNHVRSVLAGRVLSEIGRRSEDSREGRMGTGPGVHPLRGDNAGPGGATCNKGDSASTGAFVPKIPVIPRAWRADGTGLCYWYRRTLCGRYKYA